VLIYPLSGLNTEFAKNLILLGANVDLYDDKIINKYDIESNFLLSHKNLG